MIRGESEYQEAVKRLKEENARLAAQRKELSEMGLTQDQVQNAINPSLSFHLQREEEVASYERIRRGEIKELENLRGFGHLLICLRIAAGLNQKQLAEKLNVHESQVSRDERNEYHGITLERAAKILEVLGVKISIHASVDGEEEPKEELAV